MKKIIRYSIIFLSLFTLAAGIIWFCFASFSSKNTLIVHYYRYNNDYSGWNLWIWPTEPSGNGESHQFNKQQEDGFITAIVELNRNVKEIGYIIRRKENDNDWAEKDTTDDRFTREREIWIIQGDITTYTQKPDISKLPIRFVVADNPDTIIVSLMKKPENYDSFSVYQDGNKLPGISIQGSHELQVIINLEVSISDPSSYFIIRDESDFFSEKEIVMRRILDSYYYDGDDLGLIYNESKSVFKLWAPTAQLVSVALYDDVGIYNSSGKVTENETTNLHSMSRDSSTGVWTVQIPGNLEGKYYLYKVQFANGKVNWAVDPYVKAVSANGQRGAIINLNSTNPPGWKSAKPAFSGNKQDAVLYELHVRDFSIDEQSGMKNKGKFLAFTERGTKNTAGFPTGVDHIVNLGITHIHLLPSFDFASLNELSVDNPKSTDPKFNWGYDPQNYNVPEGSYSTDPSDPKIRIKEFKQMVQALHNAGIRIVMDVVYNHTFNTSTSPFELTVPLYYYRTDENGIFTNGSGCGNEVASERPMVRKYIIDSCLYWAKEYNIDGFRFDLMALHDRETMRQVSQRLWKEVDPSLIVYGEPWQAGGSPLPASKQFSIGAQRDTGIAIFNDRFRGAIKGGSDDSSRGFATGLAGMEKNIAQGVRGTIDDFTNRASESINYITCHDNLNLWDKFSLSWGANDMKNNPYSLLKEGIPLLENNVVRSVLLGNGIVLTSQGIPFFQAGDEFLRTKFGDHNSYASSDHINRIRWENAFKYHEVSNHYAGLIKLRKEHPAFRMDNKADIDRHLKILFSQDKLVAFTIGENANGDSWSNIFVAYNAAETSQTISLPGVGTWNQVVNDTRAGIEPLSQVIGSIIIPPLSMAVLYN